ncbi:hypothetical protein BDBG_07399 [Blastomyces gilchristii SLH14081]|uniref:Uncharacterized protein n=1 Tax=Blastomyces gilchristii (strain SLH14081) TaxID=559298 RepID=A0A179UVW6_BLAGS|nr:uncharacterized protein BDBG_07399 [Blastomyces gilchristii SLH14081]OAT11990.1 hypothetical protein BDBG_07399 [Blastomyces gilchristii SLH14081]
MDPKGDAVPLTSVFTPPSSCSSSWTYEEAYYNSVTGGLLMQNAFNKRDPNCFPPFFEGIGRGQIQQVYSPGYCPQGYTSPVATTNNAVTTAICCPSDYTYFTTLTTINFYSKTTIFAGCISTFPESSITTVLARTGQASLAHSVVTGPITMWGQAILVQFESKDLSMYLSNTITTSSSSTSTTASQTSTQPTPSQPANNNQPPPTSLPPSSDGKEPELSAGAKVGIAIGAVGAVGILIALVFFIRRSRRRRHHQLRPVDAIQELDTGAPRNGFWPQKFQSIPIHEMPTS